MTFEEAHRFVRERGVVLASGKGTVPRLAEVIAGEPIKGSWWAHPKGHQIFRVFQRLAESPDILICRLVGGKVTFAHRRVWPALARLAHQFQPEQLAQVREEHTAAGRHVAHEVAFPAWVPSEVLAEAKGLSESEAREVLGAEVLAACKPSKRRR
jgi:hypothetical protein